MIRSLVLCTLAASANNLLRLVLAEANKVGTTGATVNAGTSDEKALFPWWDMLTHGTGGDAWNLLDPRWWMEYILTEFKAEPAHATVETICILTILYLIVLRKPAPLQQEKLSKKEEDELIAEWKPEPLAPAWTPSNKTRYVVESVVGRTVVANGSTYLNFASTNFLGLADKPETKAACRATIEKYGVGSCGPRGFYGTFDLHLEIEAELAKFMQAEECILYSDSIACVSSVIPAFAKKGDTIILDDSVSFGIQQGCNLSRSTIYYFKHNDMAELEKVLKSVEEKFAAAHPKGKKNAAQTHRKFIVLEGVSSVYGDICPLDRVLELKDKYAYRLILDDSLGFGVLGAHGRGTIEHHDRGMQQSGSDAEPGVDILCATMDGSLGSVGGFCVGNHQVIDHQRLSGAGYCFSASSPPYTSSASLVTLDMLTRQPALCASLRKKASKLRKSLSSALTELVVVGGPQSEDSPVIHLVRKNSSPDRYAAEKKFVESINDYLRDHAGIITSVPEFIPADRTKAPPTLRINLTNLHSEADIEKLVKAIVQASAQAAKK